MSKDAEDVAADEIRGFRVYGRVQGVGFRWWTQRTGGSLGLGGHVCNRPDGSVETHARGSVEALSEFERLLHEGPSLARVDRVERIPPDSRTPTDTFLMETW